MTERLCQSCRVFYDKRLPACPECGTPKHRINVALESERFKRHLNWQADHARKN